MRLLKRMATVLMLVLLLTICIGTVAVLAGDTPYTAPLFGSKCNSIPVGMNAAEVWILTCILGIN